MNLKVISFVLFSYFFAFLLISDAAFSGAWVQRKHDLYLKFSGNYFFAKKEFNHEGRRLNIFQERIIYENTSFRDMNVTAYLEYGFSERLTLIMNLPIKTLTSKRTEIIGGGIVARHVTIHTQGLADLSISVRYALLNGPFVLSYQTGIKLPLGYEERPADDGPPLGTSKIDFEGHLLIGKSLFSLPAYLTASVGFRRRGGILHDQILFTAEGGYFFGPALAKVTFDALKSTIAPPDIVGQPVTTPLPGGGGAFPNVIQGDQDIFKISPSLIVNLTKGVAVQGEILHVYAGKNTVSGTIYSFGVIFTK